jgi:hypothetical protein
MIMDDMFEGILPMIYTYLENNQLISNHLQSINTKMTNITDKYPQFATIQSNIDSEFSEKKDFSRHKIYKLP